MRPRQSRTIKLEGFKQLTHKLGDLRLAEEPMEELLERASRIGQKAAVNAIDGGTGIAVRSISRKVWPRRMAMRVYTMIGKTRAMSINEGRKPGERETIERLAAWYKKIPFRKGIDISRKDRSAIIAIWNAIHKGGAKGKGYIIAAREAVEEELPQLIRRAMDRLKELARR